jgi:hypothetical protein
MAFQMNRHDRKSLALHRAIVAKLRAHPELFDRVRERMPPYVARGKELGSGAYVRRWAQLMTEGMDAAIAMALDEDEDGHVMRSCTPFVGVLTEDERREFLAGWQTLSSYATGEISRSEAMRRLGYTWYGQLQDALTAAGLQVELPGSVLQQMDASTDSAFGGDA